MKRLVAVVTVLTGAACAQQPQPAFQLAEVHPKTPSRRSAMQGGSLHGSRFELRKATMVDLIHLAYDVESDYVVGGPSWLDFDRFDVIAKAPPATSPETVRSMLRNLLADRFRLVVHKETRPMPAVVLSLGKGKPKLKEPSGAGETGCSLEMRPPRPDQPPVFPLVCHNATMAEFASQIRMFGDEYMSDRVVDSTGLTGRWDFTLEWTPKVILDRAGADGVSLFDAVEKQLGLKLEAQKVPAAVIVVDSANEKPAPNPPAVTANMPPAPPAEFEVAVLKQSAPDATPGGAGFKTSGRVELLDCPLLVLVNLAYNMHLTPRDEIPGAPKWIATARYDLVAKATTVVNRGLLIYEDADAYAPMLRKLLEDRLKLAAHFEDRPATAYTLVRNSRCF